MGQNTSKDSSEYLAKPSGACCLKGTVHEGEARGSWENIADVDTYIAKPPTGKANGHILLYFPDVWGMFPNGLLIMDAFADAGFLTLGLDYFRGVSFNCRVSGLIVPLETCTPKAAQIANNRPGPCVETPKKPTRHTE